MLLVSNKVQANWILPFAESAHECFADGPHFQVPLYKMHKTGVNLMEACCVMNGL